MLGSEIRFEGVRGVGTIELDLKEGQQVYTLTGENGVGKAKTLEGADLSNQILKMKIRNLHEFLQ